MSRCVKLHEIGTNSSTRRRRFIMAAKVGLALTIALSAAPAFATNLEASSAEQKRAAQKMFEAADGLYENGQFDQAAQAFRASYELVASPNSRLMIARSLRELKRYEEAYNEYLATIKDAEASAGRYPDTLRAAQAEAQALGEQLSYIIVDAVPDGTELRVNGNPTKFKAGEPVAVVESKVEIELRLPDGKVTRESLQLAKQQTQHVTPHETKPAETQAKAAATAPTPPPALPPEEKPGNGLRTAAYVAGGVGVAGLVTFGVFGALNRSAYSDLESKCTANSCAASNASQIDKGRMYQTVANVGLGVAAVGAAAAVTLFIIAPSRSERALALHVGPASFELRGGF